MNKLVQYLSLAGVFILLSSASTMDNKPGVIKLLPERAEFIPREFYIHDISDERAVKTSLGRMYAGDESGGPLAYPASLEGGTLPAIREFIRNSLKKDPSLRPLNVRIIDCRIEESLSEENHINGLVKLSLAFGLEKETGAVPLTSYRASATYQRSLSATGIAESSLRKLLTNSLKFIDGWMNEQAPGNPSLATGVRITFSDYLEVDPDTIYYQSSQPLTWNDFRGEPRSSRYSAAVFPSFGYDQHTEVINGTLQVNLAVKAYIVRSASWVSPSGRSSYALNHEQRHFDIVKLIADRFKRKLLSEKLNPDNYQGIINYEYLEFYRAMNRMQQQYDDETGHGTDAITQEEWNRRIVEELGNLIL